MLIRRKIVKDKDKNNTIAIYDNLDLQKSFVETNCRRYPTDSSTMNYEKMIILNKIKIQNYFSENTSKNQS